MAGVSPTLKLCVVLNGPPGVGKDTLADALVEHGFVKHQFKEALYTETARFFGVDRDEFVGLCNDRETKEKPTGLLHYRGTDMSPRQAMIHVSEKYIKPNVAQDFFGARAAQACMDNRTDRAVFSDGGFPVEVPPLQLVYGLVLIFRLHRDGYSFEGDSRAYLEGFPNTYDIVLEPGKPEIATGTILSAIRATEEW